MKVLHRFETRTWRGRPDLALVAAAERVLVDEGYVIVVREYAGRHPVGDEEVRRDIARLGELGYWPITLREPDGRTDDDAYRILYAFRHNFAGPEGLTGVPALSPFSPPFLHVGAEALIPDEGDGYECRDAEH